jgi:PAS domain S-box-containing protein
MAASAVFAILLWLIATPRIAAAPLHDATRRDEARMMGIIRSSMEAIITIDEAQTIVIFNPTAERVFGVTSMDAIGTSLSRFIPQRFRPAHQQHVAKFGVTGISERQMGQQLVLYGLRANGDEFPLEASISQIKEDSGKLYTVMLRDVSERVKSENALKQSREELRRLSANLQNVREEEKTRIARELHDDLGQQLTALKMDLSAVEQALFRDGNATRPIDDGVSTQLRGMRRMIDSTVASLRRIAADLRPVMLDDLGLVPAIEWLANDFTSRYGIDVIRNIEPGNSVFTKDGATALFRIVQEALNNVACHAEATNVELTLHATGPHCVLRIADNGRGAGQHEIQNARDDTSFGLIDLRERAHMLGGLVQIETAENKGFAITVTFPLQSVQQEETHS